MANFYNLPVKEIKRETEDTVSVVFDIANHKDAFNYKAGQYITLKLNINGEELRRSYSLCSSPSVDNEFRIAVKKVDNGRASGYINDTLKTGNTMEVMSPTGNFTTNFDAPKNIIAFAAGSGITPIISIIKTALKKNSNSRATLFYGNKSAATTIFKNELDTMASKYGDRLSLNYIFSRESTGNPLFDGRITQEKASNLLSQTNKDGDTEYFLCGPEDMIMSVSYLIKSIGVDSSKVHYELFTTPVKAASSPAPTKVGDFTGTSKVKVIMDDEEFEFDLATNGDNILEAAMDAGVDAPFSCKGAVCCTCKAKVIEGSARMEMNYALSDSEVEEGFILTCQSHPTSERIVVDYDVI